MYQGLKVENGNYSSLQEQEAAMCSLAVYTDVLADFTVGGINVMFTESIGCLFVAVEGTETFSDWMSNLNAFWPKTRCGIRGHRGFLKSAFKIFNKIIARIEEEIDVKLYDHIVFCGHSKGGAEAIILQELFAGLHPHYPSRAIVFGAPPCLHKDYEPKRHILRVEIDDDPVPKAMNIVPGLRHWFNMFYSKHGEGKILYDKGGTSFRDHSMKKYLKLIGRTRG